MAQPALTLLLSLLSFGAHAQTIAVNNKTLTSRACFAKPDFPFCNTSLSIDARVANLISLLEDVDIVPQLQARHGGGGSPGAPSNVSRIGLPEFDWGANALHGEQSSCIRLSTGEVKCPTSFPNPVNFGATWNVSLVHDMALIIATETRALWLAGAVEDSTWSGRPHIGLDVWSPNINIQRAPQWGRNTEAASEDPMINGQHGIAYTLGVQNGEDSRFLKLVVTLKHFDAYSLEDADGFTRHNFNAIVSNFTLADTYWPAFKASVQTGKAKGVMCSYNAVNGVPMCANNFLLKTVMRDTWGFDGYITSDSGAIEDIYKEHKYVKTEPEAACAAISNTCDVCSGAVYYDSLLAGVKAGLCSRADVDAALVNTFRLRFQLGLFDPVEDQPYWRVPPTEVATAAANATNALAALSSMILLKNTGNTLPLKAGRHVAVIGPHGSSSSALAWNYLGQLCPDDSTRCVTKVSAAISKANTGGVTSVAAGCAISGTNTSGFAAAVAAAQAADTIVLMLGIDSSVEDESRDRTSIDLPAIQHQLVTRILAVSGNKPVVIVLINGGMVAVAEEVAAPGVGAIVGAGYPGVIGADAIAATLFGDNDHCCGKLPYTVYFANYSSEIKMSDMEMDGPVGRTYRYYSGPVLFPFGYGLSIANFTHVDATPSSALESDGSLLYRTETAVSKITTISVNVTNTGNVAGDDVIMAFMAPNQTAQETKLQKQIVDYQRVHLLPGESVVVNLNVSSASFRLTAKPSGDITSVPGLFNLVVTNGVVDIAKRLVKISGEIAVVEAFPK